VRPTRHRSAARVSRGLPARTSGRWGGDERWEGGCKDARRGRASQQVLCGHHPQEKEGTDGNARHRGHDVGSRQGHCAHAPGVRCRGRSTRLRTPPSQPMSIVLPTLATPLADGFVGHHDAACEQELFHVAVAQGEARGEPDPVADDVPQRWCRSDHQSVGHSRDTHALTGGFRVIKAALDGMFGLTRGADDTVGPASCADRLIALSLINQIRDVDLQRWTPVRG
jgi:hypothetical protein